MIETNDDICGGCRFFSRDDQDGGECRRFPPTPVTDDDGCFSVFPAVPVSWWCGEYIRRTN